MALNQLTRITLASPRTLRVANTRNPMADRRDLTREQYRRARRACRDFQWECRQLADDEEPEVLPPKLRGHWTYGQTRVATEPPPRAALMRARVALSTKLTFGRLPQRKAVERLPLPGVAL